MTEVGWIEDKNKALESVGFQVTNQNVLHDALGLNTGLNSQTHSVFDDIMPKPEEYASYLDSVYETDEKPDVAEELSKIHEELAEQNKTITKIRKQMKEKENALCAKDQEIKELKAKLKKERSKNRSLKKDSDDRISRMSSELRNYQYQTDDLQLRMNEAENVLDIKKDGI